jgi:hypothetical protein
MTNLIESFGSVAYLVITLCTNVCTNWVSVGTFTPTAGWPHYDVQEGAITTNIVLVAEYKGQPKEFPLESIPGPKVGQRHVEQPLRKMNFTLPYTIPADWTNIVQGGSIVMTNILISP